MENAFRIIFRKGMNVNAVQGLLVHTARKLMLVHQVHAPTMEFVWICLRVMKAIHISVFVPTVSIEFLENFKQIYVVYNAYNIII